MTFALGDAEHEGFLTVGDRLVAEHGCILALRGGCHRDRADCFLGPGDHPGLRRFAAPAGCGRQSRSYKAIRRML